ncbi:MAG: hypothetical protein FNNCIFGK_00939 [Bacteroidia bacterium]|nr:hypothetical protein [Bacteroidia bacterium]
MYGFHSVLYHRNFHNNLFMQFGKFFAFCHNAFKICSNNFCTHIPRNNVADVHIMLHNCIASFNSFFGHQCGVGSHAIQYTQFISFLYLCKVCCINKKFHLFKLIRLSDFIFRCQWRCTGFQKFLRWSQLQLFL